MTPEDCARAARATAALIDVIRDGQLAALPETVHRLEGARLVLELLAQGEMDPTALMERLQEPPG